MVSQLIDETSAIWNEAVKNEYFLPVDAWVILNIPLCTRRQLDYWAWNFDRKGIFSVHSAYHMMINTVVSRENYFDGNTVNSNLEAETKGWTAGVLCVKHRSLLKCTLCGECGSCRHSVLECNMASSIWALTDDLVVEHLLANNESNVNTGYLILHPNQNIRCFSFVKEIYLDIF
jgi:hypothetical protein